MYSIEGLEYMAEFLGSYYGKGLKDEQGEDSSIWGTQWMSDDLLGMLVPARAENYDWS